MRDKACTWAEGIAGDPSHGYDQSRRWGPDYDCSSLVISAWEQAGVPVKTAGATYTGNMRRVFLTQGFSEPGGVDLATGAGLERGDVLLNEVHHTALYLGGGRIVEAAINERGGITGGETGDQTGQEIRIRSYYNYPWNCVLRYGSGETAPAGVCACARSLPELRLGSRGGAVLALQILLIHKWAINCGPDEADGDYGSYTRAAVQTYQRAHGLDADGICGVNTWMSLIGWTV